MTLPLTSRFRIWISGLYQRHTSNRAERIRLTIFLGSLLMVFAIMPLHFIGLLGMPFIHLQAITLAFILLAVVSLVLLTLGALSLVQASNMLFIGGQLIQTFRIVLLTLHPEWANHEIMTENFLISYRHRPYQYPPKAWSKLCRGFTGGSQELGASRSISSSDSPVIPAIRSLEIPAAFIA